MEINSATIPKSKYPNAYKINAFSPILKNSHVPSKKNSAMIIGSVQNKFIDDNNSDDTNCNGWEPDDSTNLEETIINMITLKELIDEVSIKYPEAKQIFPLLIENPQIRGVIEKLNLGKGKTQSYAHIRKIQKYAKKLFEEKFR